MFQLNSRVVLKRTLRSDRQVIRMDLNGDSLNSIYAEDHFRVGKHGRVKMHPPIAGMNDHIGVQFKDESVICAIEHNEFKEWISCSQCQCCPAIWYCRANGEHARICDSHHGGSHEECCEPLSGFSFNMSELSPGDPAAHWGELKESRAFDTPGTKVRVSRAGIPDWYTFFGPSGMKWLKGTGPLSGEVGIVADASYGRQAVDNGVGGIPVVFKRLDSVVMVDSTLLEVLDGPAAKIDRWQAASIRMMEWAQTEYTDLGFCWNCQRAGRSSELRPISQHSTKLMEGVIGAQCDRGHFSHEVARVDLRRFG